MTQDVFHDVFWKKLTPCCCCSSLRHQEDSRREPSLRFQDFGCLLPLFENKSLCYVVKLTYIRRRRMKICGGGRRTSMRKRRFKRLPSRLCHPPTIFVCEREKERERESFLNALEQTKCCQRRKVRIDLQMKCQRIYIDNGKVWRRKKEEKREETCG